MWVENGTRLLSLYGAEVEQPAIPTLFVSSGHAWDALPEDLRARVRGRAAVHCQDATDQRRGGAIEDVLVSTFDDIIKVTLPIAYPHPRTNRTLLYVCPQMTHSVAGLTWEESEDLLETLFDHLYAPKNILEHHWRQGDLVLWDNIAMQHARPNVSAEGPARKLRKTIAPTPRLDAARPQYRKVAEEA
jgi:taurine dioxygenase